MTLLNRADAAAARSLKTYEPVDRPRQRSADAHQRWEGGYGCPTPSIRSSITIARAKDDPAGPAAFDGMASVTGAGYTMYDMFGEYEELVAVGAFEQTLAQEDLQVPLVLDHTSSRRIAQLGNPFSPLELSEITDGERTGLHVVAPSLQMRDPDTAYIVPKLELQLIDEMSFRFTIDAGRWSDDFTTFTIQRVNLHRGDVSIVGYGASPHTAGSGLRQKQPSESDRLALALAKARSLDGDRRYARLL